MSLHLIKMNRFQNFLVGGAVLACFSFYLYAQDDTEKKPEQELGIDHANCSFFGPMQSHYKKSGLEAQALKKYEFSRVADAVSALLPRQASSSKQEARAATSDNLIDVYLVQLWKDNGVTPARRTNDYEFIRRASIDVTGKIPTAARVQQFVASEDPQKRVKLVDELLASQAYVDKWTMYFGDLYKNTVRTTQVVRYNEGRNAFYQWINKSVAQNKAYDQMMTELVTSQTGNTYENGDGNWMVGGFVTGGPVQDIFDQMAVNTATTFLGVNHMNCLMCHDGRRHMDTLSLWGKSATRLQGFQLSAFFSRTDLQRVRIDPSNPQNNQYYWSVQDNTRFRTDYGLNTTTGNRPPRAPVGTMRVVAPEYLNGAKPAGGENYRVSLAKQVAGDFQFARATVNYIWKEYMTKGFVEPANQFDLARLDPDNPPEDPWTLQPNQPRLLNALAQNFIETKFNIKQLMRTILLSDAYQLSSQYDAGWKAQWEDMYARHLPDRLWAEEIHDAIVQASNLPVNYQVPGIGVVNWAMKLPDVRGLGNSEWLDSFYRGNRDNEDRRAEGSILQVLNLMNDNFVMSRTRSSGAGDAASLLRKAMANNSTDTDVVNTLYLNVLSRPPGDGELRTALDSLRQGNRQQKAEDLLWSLFNKVDFIFNY